MGKYVSPPLIHNTPKVSFKIALKQYIIGFPSKNICMTFQENAVFSLITRATSISVSLGISFTSLDVNCPQIYKAWFSKSATLEGLAKYF